MLKFSVVRHLRRLNGAALRFAEFTGRYEGWAAGERRTRQAEAVTFSGDVPPTAGCELNQCRLVFAQPQAPITHATRVVYTRGGMAWVDGRLQRRYSFQEIGARQVLEGAGTPVRTVERATILQAQTPCTYGDWVSEHVAYLALALTRGALTCPLLLPERWWKKPYVQRDLAILGIESEAVDVPVRIERATIVNKTRPGHYWVREEAEAVLSAMKIRPRLCVPGGALYLSRRGERGEGPQRRINNEVTEAAMEAAGVKVVRTAGRTLEDYLALAPLAETLFFDHGSAGYNMMQWRTRRVVELFTPDYWDSAFLFLADALGIVDYHLWRIDTCTTIESLAERIRTLINAPPAPDTTHAPVAEGSNRPWPS